MSEQASGPIGLTGGCQCGAVRYRVEATPTGTSVCHCRMCQKAGGAPFMAFADVPTEAFVVTRGALATFRSSEIAERGFCAACGTPLTYRLLDGGYTEVTLGSFADPAVRRRVARPLARRGARRPGDANRRMASRQENFIGRRPATPRSRNLIQ